MHASQTDMTYTGLPDPARQGYFYEGVPGKRLIAFLIDTVLICLGAVLLLPFTVFTALFFFPAFLLVVGFFYRAGCLAAFSATLGMMLAGIEIRDRFGQRLNGGLAVLHTLVFSVMAGTVVLMLISAAMMIGTPRRQGLHDLLLGTAAIRRPG